MVKVKSLLCQDNNNELFTVTRLIIFIGSQDHSYRTINKFNVAITGMNNTCTWSQLLLHCRLREWIISGHSSCVNIVEIIIFSIKLL